MGAITPAGLFNLFVGGQTATDEIAKMSIGDLERQIGELRQSDPDDEIDMSSREIAWVIRAYAKDDVTPSHNDYPQTSRPTGRDVLFKR